MAPVTAAILSLYSIALQVAPTLARPAFTMVKFDPAVVSAATIGNKLLGSDSSAPTISFPLLPYTVSPIQCNRAYKMVRLLG